MQKYKKYESFCEFIWLSTTLRYGSQQNITHVFVDFIKSQ